MDNHEYNKDQTRMTTSISRNTILNYKKDKVENES